VTFLDTAGQYGAGHNEVLLGRAVHGQRDKAQLATKFGFDRSRASGAMTIRGDAGYVRYACDSSLLQLRVDVINLYYIHRPPQNVPIEETVGAMAELVAAGKVRYLGVCESGADLLRRAYVMHPITAMQSEYSIWTRDVEATVPTTRELEIGLVAHAPLARGFLTGAIEPGSLDSADFRASNPRSRGSPATPTWSSQARSVVWLAGSVPRRPRWRWPGFMPRPTD
jgi:aryl-alcohol dehydrogenase-like predicted oxidoreductase